MKLEVGKFYVNRVGDVIQIVERDKYGTSHPYSDLEGSTYMSDGRYREPYCDDDLDLVRVQF